MRVQLKLHVSLVACKALPILKLLLPIILSMVVPWQPSLQQAIKKFRKALAPLVEGFIRVPFGDIEAIEEAAIQHRQISWLF